MTNLAEHWCHRWEWMPWQNWMPNSAPEIFLSSMQIKLFVCLPLHVGPSNERTERRKSTCLHVRHLGPILLKRSMTIQQRSKTSIFISIQTVLWKASKISPLWYKNGPAENDLEFLPWNSSKSYSYRFSRGWSSTKGNL